MELGHLRYFVAVAEEQNVRAHGRGFTSGMCDPHFCSMNITEDVPSCAAEQSVAEQEALQKGIEEISREYVKKGSKIYAKA